MLADETREIIFSNRINNIVSEMRATLKYEINYLLYEDEVESLKSKGFNVKRVCTKPDGVNVYSISCR